MDFKNLSVVLVFNIITQAMPIGVAIYLAIKFATKSIHIMQIPQENRKEKI